MEVRKLNKSNIVFLLPENLKKYKNLNAVTVAFAEILEKIEPEIEALNTYKDMEKLNSSILDELAWQHYVEFYNPNLAQEKKIDMIKKSYKHHVRKGTVGAVESAIKTIVGDAEVLEWFNYNGQPFTFRILSRSKVPENGDITELVKLANAFKNARSTLDGIIFIQNDHSSLGAHGVVHTFGRTINREVK